MLTNLILCAGSIEAHRGMHPIKRGDVGIFVVRLDVNLNLDGGDVHGHHRVGRIPRAMLGGCDAIGLFQNTTCRRRLMRHSTP